MAKNEKINEPFDVVDIDSGITIPFPKRRERKKDKDGNVRGAPYVYVTPEQWHTVEIMAQLMATDEEIASALQVSAKTLNDDYHGNFFRALKKKGQSSGKISLRRAQFESAIKNKNVTMQIFLGKQLLGQKDQVETNTPDTKININVSAATTEDISVDD